jgi:hypothetical protein
MIVRRITAAANAEDQIVANRRANASNLYYSSFNFSNPKSRFDVHQPCIEHQISRSIQLSQRSAISLIRINRVFWDKF